MRMGAAQLAALIALALAACSRAQPPAVPPLVDVDASLAAARADFDAHVGEARFIALLSPT